MAERQDPFAGAEWGSEDSQNLRNFLKTPTGRRLVFRLRNDRPSLGLPPNGTGTFESAALISQQANGYEQAVNNLFAYIVAEPEELRPVEMYPDLDDDTLWPAELQTVVRPNSTAAEPHAVL